MKSGLDVAQLWLDGEETLVYTTDRDKHIFPINMVDGHAITHDPLVILVSYRIFLLFSVVKKVQMFIPHGYILQIYCFICSNHPLC